MEDEVFTEPAPQPGSARRQLELARRERRRATRRRAVHITCAILTVAMGFGSFYCYNHIRVIYDAQAGKLRVVSVEAFKKMMAERAPSGAARPTEAKAQSAPPASPASNPSTPAAKGSSQFGLPGPEAEGTPAGAPAADRAVSTPSSIAQLTQTATAVEPPPSALPSRR